MIYRLYSDLSTFKQLDFNPGFNILLSDKNVESSEQQTRNRSGKTSLIELIHFLTGADCNKESIFKSHLEDYTFGICFDLDKSKTIVERSGKTCSELVVRNTDFSRWPKKLSFNKKSNEYMISNTNWKVVLGSLIFGLDVNNICSYKYSPTFRSLFPYFVRRDNSGAFESYEKQSSKQQLYDQQIAISYLFGLDWRIPQKWQLVRDREKTLKELKKAIGEGGLSDFIGTASQLRTELALAEKDTKRLKSEIQSFHVEPQYRELEEKASGISLRINELSNENTMDYELIKELERSIENEIPPSSQDILKIYRESEIVFNQNIVARFEELKEFHDSIIQNRKSYLVSEISDANQRIRNRDITKKELGERLSSIMEILNSRGALDQFNKLSSEVSKKEAKTELLRQKYYTAEQLERNKVELDIERANLLSQLQRDFQEQNELISEIVVTFGEISSELYEEAGNLEVRESNNGPVFDIKIQGKSSKGIRNMQIFCFDMMLMEILSKRGTGPDILVHDSHLFDPVDERQVATALKIGIEKSQEFGFQYIVTMNSDKIPDAGLMKYNFDDYVLPVRLTDSTEDGGLFGFRF